MSQYASCCIFAHLMISDETLQLAKKLWDYHHMHHALEKADCILTLGSHDLRVAERAAELYLEGWAPLMNLFGRAGELYKRGVDRNGSRPVCCHCSKHGGSVIVNSCGEQVNEYRREHLVYSAVAGAKKY